MGGKYSVISDQAAEAGPLAGISAILTAASHETVLVLAVDLPRMSREFLKHLVIRSGGSGLIPFRGNRFEPLAAVYTRACAGAARDCLSRGEFSLQNFCRAIVGVGLASSVAIGAEHDSLFANINTPADLAHIELM